MLAFVSLTSQVVAYALTGRNLGHDLSGLGGWRKPEQTVSKSFKCSNSPAIGGLDKAADTHLKHLSKYQEICHSSASNTLMIFGDMPNSDAEARDKAKYIADILKEFKKFNVNPLVIIEPVTSWGDIDFTEFETGFYDNWIHTYFESLKQNGVTNDSIGTWVPFPEANLPYWNRNNAQPDDFSAIVNKYLAIAHKTFPNIKGSVLLNSATYSADDFDWQNGEYISLVPYVKNLDKNLVQSFGLQGFPWAPPASGQGAGIFDASEFLNYKLAKEAADALGVKDVWFNTGTFSTKYYGDSARQITIDPQQRTDTLRGITIQALALKQAGYNVSVNLFAQNKSLQAEATDWSYFSNEIVLNSPNSPVFYTFASELNQNNIPLWLFDTYE